MERIKVIRFFSIYMIALYLWAFYLESRSLKYTSKAHDLFGSTKAGLDGWWYTLFIAPCILYLVASIILVPLIRYPDLIYKGWYAKLVAYTLAPFATAWISGSAVLSDWLLGYKPIPTKIWYLYFLLIYPVIYVVYAYLVY